MPKTHSMVTASLGRVFSRYHTIHGPLLAKGLAFSTLFALVPLLFLLTIAGSFALTPAVMEILEREMLEVLPAATRTSIIDGLTRFARNPRSLSVLTVPLFLWSVHAFFFDIHRIVRAAFNLPVSPRSGRLRALGLNGVFLLLLYVSALLSVGIQFAVPWLPGPPWLLNLAGRAVALVLLAAVLWSMIRLSAGVPLAKRSSIPVTLLAALIWQGTSWVFSLFIQGTGRRVLLYGVLAAAISILALTRIYAEILLQTALWAAELDPRYPYPQEHTPQEPLLNAPAEKGQEKLEVKEAPSLPPATPE